MIATNSILIPVTDSQSSRAVIDSIAGLFLCPDNVTVTLLYIHRTPSGGEALMGRQFISSRPEGVTRAMDGAKETLVKSGLKEENIQTESIEGAFPTVADGIIAFFTAHPHTLVVIGRKKMSKAEEFVLGDVSVKLVRVLEETAVMVVKIS